MSMGKRVRKGADEYDVFSRWRYVLHWRSGEVAQIKRRARRRERRVERQRSW